MEGIRIENDALLFDAAVHGGMTPGVPSLPEGGNLAIFVKPRATVGGKPAAVITFTVQTPDGKPARAQIVTTVAILEGTLAVLKGWREGGHLD